MDYKHLLVCRSTFARQQHDRRTSREQRLLILLAVATVLLQAYFVQPY